MSPAPMKSGRTARARCGTTSCCVLCHKTAVGSSTSAARGSSDSQRLLGNPILNGNQPTLHKPLVGNPAVTSMGTIQGTYQLGSCEPLSCISGAHVEVPQNTELLLSCSSAGGMPSVALEVAFLNRTGGSSLCDLTVQP